jgi:hypothetical protein
LLIKREASEVDGRRVVESEGRLAGHLTGIVTPVSSCPGTALADLVLQCVV